MATSAPKKSRIINALIKELELQIHAALKAAQDARSGSAHGENQAKSKYETQSTELSYLADGQNQRAAAFAKELTLLKKLTPPDFSPDSAIKPLSLVQLENPEGSIAWYFITNAGAGRNVIIEGVDVRVINTSSPLGQSLIGLYDGDETPLGFTITATI